ncbi:hypothetical protein ACT3QO_14250, partial [Psychrobacter sp. AOP7-D1-15]|uniref:hypothetical protein n=1 Tax=unclassified Psychrobacter TaxID=196806 RepID=UPI00402BC2D5
EQMAIYDGQAVDDTTILFEIITKKYTVYRGSRLIYKYNPRLYIHYKTYDEMPEKEKRLQLNIAKIRHT